MTENLRITYCGGEVALTAANELGVGLKAMTGCEMQIVEDAGLPGPRILAQFGDRDKRRKTYQAPDIARLSSSDDSFAVGRAEKQLVIQAGTVRGLIHGACDLLERLGASFPVAVPPRFPHFEVTRLETIEPYSVKPSFTRRAFVSDIMTWQYTNPEGFELHLRHDREFVPWMARRGINAFSYIRHAFDSKLRIDQIAPLLRSYGIGAEYGGHVLQILLPRDRFETEPSMFPADENGNRLMHGNLCISNRAALNLVCDGALQCIRDYPENQLLHIWGADVRGGAWCRCGDCRELSPQLQYMAVVNAIAEKIGEEKGVTYLAYHDTIDPHRGLHPMPNVWLEWAPRERCYSHAIDDAACDVNPRYFDSLRRYLEIFEGRCHVFEYYADAILFGGLAFATPQTIARDMRAYHRLGIRSISCLTFGAYSLFAYPVNLETFVRCAKHVDSEPDTALEATAQGRHPSCAPAMSEAYRAIAEASRLVLDYADVIPARMDPAKAHRKRAELAQAMESFRRGVAALEYLSAMDRSPTLDAERKLWEYSTDALRGISEYLEAKESAGSERARRGGDAISQIADTIEHVRSIDREIKGTWGAYDIELAREMWLRALKRGLELDVPHRETSDGLG